MRKITRYVTPMLREVPSEDEGKSPVLQGYAVVYDATSQTLLDTTLRSPNKPEVFREKVRPGAITSSLANNDIYAFYQHDTKQPLGSTSAGNLTLSEDEHGLAFSLTPPNTQLGRDLVELVRSGIIKGLSFGAYLTGESWESDDQGDIHVIDSADLFEISFVTYPAFPDTEVVARAVQEKVEREDSRRAELRALESWIGIQEISW